MLVRREVWNKAGGAGADRGALIDDVRLGPPDKRQRGGHGMGLSRKVRQRAPVHRGLTSLVEEWLDRSA